MHPERILNLRKKSNIFGQGLNWCWEKDPDKVSFPRWGRGTRVTGESTTFCERIILAKKSHMMFNKTRLAEKKSLSKIRVR